MSHSTVKSGKKSGSTTPSSRSTKPSPNEKHQFYREILEACRVVHEKWWVPGTKQLIRGRWEMGKVIMESQNNGAFERTYGEATLNQLAADLGVGTRTLYDCLKLHDHIPTVKKLDQFCTMVQNQNGHLSWRLVRTSLPTNHRENHERIVTRIEIDRLERQLESLEERIAPQDKMEFEGLKLKGEELLKEARTFVRIENDTNPGAEAYLALVKRSPCCVCRKAPPSELAHFPRTRGAGALPHECIPLCHTCHQEHHTSGTDTFLAANKNQIFAFFYDLVVQLMEGGRLGVASSGN